MYLQTPRRLLIDRCGLKLQWFAFLPFHTAKHHPTMYFKKKNDRTLAVSPILTSLAIDACPAFPACISCDMWHVPKFDYKPTINNSSAWPQTKPELLPGTSLSVQCLLRRSENERNFCWPQLPSQIKGYQGHAAVGGIGVMKSTSLTDSQIEYST